MIADDTYYHRGELPHLEKLHKTYFITFCTVGRFQLPPIARDIVLAHIGRAHGIAYYLHLGVVMPDHVHVIVSPYELVSLKQVMQMIKGASSFYVNEWLNRGGRLWQRESFNHILRKDESVKEKSDYILQNPVRAGLVSRFEDYPWIWISRPAG